MNLQELKKIAEAAKVPFDDARGLAEISYAQKIYSLETIPDKILQLITNYEKAVEALKKMANEDFRGNRPQSAVDAYKTLKDLGEL